VLGILAPEPTSPGDFIEASINLYQLPPTPTALRGLEFPYP
jgi:hypothetical protein